MANQAEFEARLIEQKAKLSPADRRKMEAEWPWLLTNMYHPELNTGFKFPFIPQEITAKIIGVCPSGTAIVINGMKYNASLVARICDFQKSIPSIGDGVICVVR